MIKTDYYLLSVEGFIIFIYIQYLFLWNVYLLKSETSEGCEVLEETFKVNNRY
jgi:hypothetical protein